MFHKHDELTKGRVQAFLNRKDLLKTLVYRGAEVVAPVRLMRHRTVFEAPVSFEEATSGGSCAQFQDITGTALSDVKMSPPWSTHWFRIEFGALPAVHGEQLHFRWDSGCEAMLWNVRGEPIDSFTGASDETLRDTHVITADEVAAVVGRPLVYFVEVACNEMFGLSADWVCGPAAPKTSAEFVLKRCEIAVHGTSAAALYYDLSVLLDIAKTVPEGSQSAATALSAADAAINACVIERPETVEDARKITAQCFQTLAMATPMVHTVYCVGNCHIDTAWLWRYRETRRKSARSWVAQLRLCERFPEYRFAFSQAQQVEWLKEDYPSLFAEVKKAVAAGRFVPVGATWVEMDCNIPSGESLVRQFVFGQRLFVREFGKPCDIFWLPDTFGYSAQIPQIMKLAGVPHFLTQKLSWNQFNKFPYSTFIWCGLDGSECITHFPPAETYTGRIDAAQTLKSETNHKDKDRCPASLMLYGHGDGGGGPQQIMLERLHRLASVPALPSVRHGTPAEFFKVCDENAGKLLRWHGELYFELHRGTYTT
jgi:alpha-mannosidase